MSNTTIRSNGTKGEITINGVNISDAVSRIEYIHEAGKAPVLKLYVQGTDVAINSSCIPELPEAYKSFYIRRDGQV